MTTEKEKVPAIYGAVANVLKAMAVEKGGVLPGNMGGKPYITAVDLSAEAKRQFVANNIILIPNETVTKHDIEESGGRKMIVVGIRGEYTLIHTGDGSSVTISGAGDGMALGTSVASNIASTNALKNALLRTFLITEQSVEDEAKNGAAGDKTPQAVQNARKAPAPAKNAGDAKSKVQAWIGDDDKRRQWAIDAFNKAKKTLGDADKAYAAVLAEIESAS